MRDLTAQLEASSSLQGHIVVQAGVVNLRAESEPAVVANQLTALWQSIRDRGGIPVAVLVPPSNDDASQIIALNTAIVAAAQASGTGVLDLHTSVSTSAGLWAAGLSDDGDIANAAGSNALAAAAEAQLPALLATR
nr:SGNH/GDSL hydrolase family protein [Clavibacter michiganensis]